MAFHTPKQNVHVFTDNIVRKVSSEQICPRLLWTCLSSNIVEVLTIQKADPFPYFLYRALVNPPPPKIFIVKKGKNILLLLGPNPTLICPH